MISLITDNCRDPVGQAISVRRKMERDGGRETQGGKAVGSWGKLDEELVLCLTPRGDARHTNR